MTSIATAASVYARVALGPGEVLPVRAPHRVVDRETDRQQGTQFAAKGQGRRQSQARALQTPPINVVALPVVNQQRVPPTPPIQKARPFVPFLAQQIAQEGLPDRGPEADRRRKHEAVSEAYLLASDDAANILGPVRPRELVV